MADEIRPARGEDLPALTEIYNYYVHHTPITFDVTAKTLTEQTQWFAQFAEPGRHQLLVALQAGVVVGYEALFTRLRKEDVHKVFAGITLPNEASIKLHERQGFTYLGTFTEVGRKFDRYWDVAWYQKDLSQQQAIR